MINKPIFTIKEKGGMSLQIMCNNIHMATKLLQVQIEENTKIFHKVEFYSPSLKHPE